MATLDTTRNRNTNNQQVRGLADIDSDLQQCQAQRDELIKRIGELDSRIMDLQDEAMVRITGHKKRGRRRHQSGLHNTLGQA